jgi:DNA invertase Pin-like site-specific DNA recombinase
MNEYVIAKYIRLSLDDAISESLSIPHQRLLLDEYIEELDIPNAEVLEFVDNGYTGTNLERPGFQEMIELVRCGKVNCIVTKDFSRFARNEIESGYYIEQVFPLFRVRFIAIGDSFDSNDHQDGTGGIDSAFRFLMYEYYSKDLSKKIKAAKRVLMENGEYIVAGAVHGYRKNDKGRWEHDPDAAEAIRLIFQLALEGLSTSQIRDRLFMAKFPSPREYDAIKSGKDVVPKFMWATKQIFRILTNVQYTGCYVAGKHETTRIGGKGVKKVDESDWIIIHDSHPALVSKEDFEKIQAMLANPKALSPDKPVPSRISESCKSAITSGERKSCAVPFGYTRDCNGDWVVFEKTAIVIKEIYAMTLQGLSLKEICDKLHEAGYPTPSEQVKINKGHDMQPTNLWKPQAVKDILQDEQYIGTYIAGKSFQLQPDCDCCADKYAKKNQVKKCRAKKYNVPKNEWVRIPDKKPAIIDKDSFAKVQIIRANVRKNMSRRDYLLSGLTACCCCGFAMVYNESTNIPTYRCMKTHANPAADCHKMKVSADILEGSVISIIKKQAEVVLTSDDLSGFRKSSEDIRINGDYEKQVLQLTKLRQECYEQFVSGEIDRDAFQMLKADYTAQIDKLNNQLAVLKQVERDNNANKKVESHAKNALSETAAPRDIVNALIDKVFVFPNNHIEIRWKFANFAEGL